jgi:hypothetical protein
MHQVGELFIEAITEVAYDPIVAETSDHSRTEDPILLAQDMRFKAVIRGWSHQAHQVRTIALQLGQENAGESRPNPLSNGLVVIVS